MWVLGAIIPSLSIGETSNNVVCNRTSFTIVYFILVILKLFIDFLEFIVRIYWSGVLHWGCYCTRISSGINNVLILFYLTAHKKSRFSLNARAFVRQYGPQPEIKQRTAPNEKEMLTVWCPQATSVISIVFICSCLEILDTAEQPSPAPLLLPLLLATLHGNNKSVISVIALVWPLIYKVRTTGGGVDNDPDSWHGCRSADVLSERESPCRLVRQRQSGLRFIFLLKQEDLAVLQDSITNSNLPVTGVHLLLPRVNHLPIADKVRSLFCHHCLLLTFKNHHKHKKIGAK